MRRPRGGASPCRPRKTSVPPPPGSGNGAGLTPGERWGTLGPRGVWRGALQRRCERRPQPPARPGVRTLRSCPVGAVGDRLAALDRQQPIDRAGQQRGDVPVRRQVRATLLEALRPHPEARQAVAARLVALEGQAGLRGAS